MRLKKVYVRFYKSFNYDYERKFSRSSDPEPWEILDDNWYPFVRMDLEDTTTTIVGANEAGKSHLLDSIEKLITGKEIERSDFCRYSKFFSVQQGQRRCPDFGGEFELASDEDVRQVDSLGLKVRRGDRLHIFRLNGAAPVAFLPGRDKPLQLDPSALNAALPSVLRLHANLPLPASIPLIELAPNARRPFGSRRTRRTVYEGVLGKPWQSADEFQKAAPGIFGLISSSAEQVENGLNLDRQYELGRALLFRVARIDESTFEDLAEAIADEREGYVNGVIQCINASLATYLNFPRWWAQDREFRLMVSPREYELVFTIRDRTGTDYSFSERSNGLKYFLSYHVQLLAHTPPQLGRREILLMDEPDAYLSSQGQQDLVRILEEFAVPEDRSREVQVVYVTHSPFLINRNFASRIRVLDKGVSDEGTRVVRDVARNHYEPLRSSLGAFVAETSFIGGSNLFVEGLADQVLLAGLNSHLLSKGTPQTQLLDLNAVTIVPSGSASSVPYLVYLARGRDVVRPPCVALLDSDAAGHEAATTLSRGGPRRQQLLQPKFIIELGAWAQGTGGVKVDTNVAVQELEDLVPIPVAVEAANRYARKFLDPPDTSQGLVAERVAEELRQSPGRLFDALSRAFGQKFGGDAHIEKVGFAKEVVALIGRSDVAADSLSVLENNFGQLLSAVARTLRAALVEEQVRRQNNRLNRTIAAFLSDYPNATSREKGRLLVEEVQDAVEDTEAGDRVRLGAQKLIRDYSLDEDLTAPIDRFAEFRQMVDALRYEERLANQEAVLEETPVADADRVPLPSLAR